MTAEEQLKLARKHLLRACHALCATCRRAHQRCDDKPAQGNALGTKERRTSPERAAHVVTPLQGLRYFHAFPRALPWAGLSPGLWPYSPHATQKCMTRSK